MNFPNLLARCFAILLVPCLILDPALAAGTVSAKTVSSSTLSASFDQEALVIAIQNVRLQILQDGNWTWRNVPKSEVIARLAGGWINAADGVRFMAATGAAMFTPIGDFGSLLLDQLVPVLMASVFGAWSYWIWRRDRLLFAIVVGWAVLFGATQIAVQRDQREIGNAIKQSPVVEKVAWTGVGGLDHDSPIGRLINEAFTSLPETPTGRLTLQTLTAVNPKIRGQVIGDLGNSVGPANLGIKSLVNPGGPALNIDISAAGDDYDREVTMIAATIAHEATHLRQTASYYKNGWRFWLYNMVIDPLITTTTEKEAVVVERRLLEEKYGRKLADNPWKGNVAIAYRLNALMSSFKSIPLWISWWGVSWLLASALRKAGRSNKPGSPLRRMMALTAKSA
jgi:hypothetical protein